MKTNEDQKHHTTNRPMNGVVCSESPYFMGGPPRIVALLAHAWQVGRCSIEQSPSLSSAHVEGASFLRRFSTFPQ